MLCSVDPIAKEIATNKQKKKDVGGGTHLMENASLVVATNKNDGLSGVHPYLVTKATHSGAQWLLNNLERVSPVARITRDQNIQETKKISVNCWRDRQK